MKRLNFTNNPFFYVKYTSGTFDIAYEKHWIITFFENSCNYLAKTWTPTFVTTSAISKEGWTAMHITSITVSMSSSRFKWCSPTRIFTFSGLSGLFFSIIGNAMCSSQNVIFRDDRSSTTKSYGITSNVLYINLIRNGIGNSRFSIYNSWSQSPFGFSRVSNNTLLCYCNLKKKSSKL